MARQVLFNSPFAAGELNVPDMSQAEYRASLDNLRQQLKADGDSRWMLDDVALANQFSYEAQAGTIQQPPTPLERTAMTLTELANTINVRRRFPSYRSDLHIPPEIEQTVSRFASGFRDSQLLAIPPQQPTNISDDVAVAGISRDNQDLAVPLTFNNQENDMRRKVSFPSIPSAFHAYPANVPALGVIRSLNGLCAFSAFSDDPQYSVDDTAPSDFTYVPDGSQVDIGPSVTGQTPTTSGWSSLGSSLISSLPGLVTAGTNVYATVANTNQAKTNAANTNSLLNTLLGRNNTPGAPTNYTPILILGGAAILAVILLSRKK